MTDCGCEKARAELEEYLHHELRREDAADIREHMENCADCRGEYRVGIRPEERAAIIARVEMDYTYPEMAVALGKPSAEAARKAAQRALVRLAEEMRRG